MWSLSNGLFIYTQVIWKKEGTGTAISVNRLVFIRDNRISLNINKLNWDLIIKDVNPSDSGKYICLAMDGSRSVKTIYNLEVLPVSGKLIRKYRHLIIYEWVFQLKTHKKESFNVSINMS